MINANEIHWPANSNEKIKVFDEPYHSATRGEGTYRKAIYEHIEGHHSYGAGYEAIEGDIDRCLASPNRYKTYLLCILSNPLES